MVNFFTTIRSVLPEICARFVKKVKESFEKLLDLDPEPDGFQNLIISSLSIIHNFHEDSFSSFLCEFANRQTDRQANRQTDRRLVKYGDTSMLDKYNAAKVKNCYKIAF